MKFVLMLLVLETTMATTLFVAAGRADLPWFWAVLAIHAGIVAIGYLTLDPELRQERLRPGPGNRDPGTRRIAILLMLAHLVIAGLDVRYGWSRTIPDGVRAVALIAYAGGLALSIWAMAINRFYSSVVRIQDDRGQRVITDGPYRVVRHPGYVGTITASICGGIALGSWWSLVPLIPLLGLFLRRTMREDRMLREQLDGYADYAARVRYRLLPGLW